MNERSLNDLIIKLKEYNPEEIEIVKKAYEYSDNLHYQLNNKDRVRIVTDDLAFGPREDWIDKATTTYAKRKIREFNKK